MKIQAVRGMQDILPAQKALYRIIDDVVRSVLSDYGYQEIGLPVIEDTQLFTRLVGESTDIVEKEMYTFLDRSGDGIALRPEGTAGCVRYALENGLLFNQVQRFWYSGPMFRYERPQKGRYRQFEQIGAECFGMSGPDIDAEMLLMTWRIFKRLGVSEDVQLELNSLGNVASREAFKQALVAFLSNFESELDEDSRRRLTTNPLRILDSKVLSTQALIADAPRLSDYLDDDSKAHFDSLCGILRDNGLDFVINPLIVRGLDYYNKTVFEWITSSLGSQGTVCGGGRYDGLVEQLGGKPTPSVGFGMGHDRLALMLADRQSAVQPNANVYIVSQGTVERQGALQLGEQLREQVPGLKVIVHCGEGKFKAQLKKADASGAALAIILGEDEIKAGTATIKKLRENSEQEELSRSAVVSYCSTYFQIGRES